jgi:hypothetical protein
MALIPPVVDLESHLAPTPQSYNPAEVGLGVAIEHENIGLDLEQTAEVTPPATISVQPEWDTSVERVFNELVEKEALGHSTREDLAELEHLANLRRQTEMPRTGADIVREYEQGQLIRDLLKSLTRYVEFEQNNPRPNSTRPRPKAKA